MSTRQKFNLLIITNLYIRGDILNRQITDGTDSRFQRLIENLKKSFNVTWMYVGNKEYKSDDVEIIQIKTKKPNYSKYYNKLIYKIFLDKILFGHIGPTSYEYHSNSMMIKKYIKRKKIQQNFDMILLYYFLPPKVIKEIRNNFPNSILAIDTVDIQYDREKKIFYNESFFTGLRKTLYLKRLKKAETKAYRQSDVLIAVSSSDKGILKKINPMANIFLCPTSTGYTNFDQDISIENRGNIIAFYGAMRGKENIKAAITFAKKIFPSILMKVPDAMFYIIGSNPVEKIKSLHNGKTIIVTGYLENPFTVLTKTKCVVCPFDISYGTRSRLYETLSIGLPAVVTSFAVNGMDLEDCPGVIVTDDYVQFGNYVSRLLQDNSYWNELSQSNLKWFEEFASPSATYGKLNTNMYSICLKHFS